MARPLLAHLTRERMARLFGAAAAYRPAEAYDPGPAGGSDLERLLASGAAPAAGSGDEPDEPARGRARRGVPRLTPSALAGITVVVAVGVAWAAWLGLRSAPQADGAERVPVRVPGVVATAAAPALSAGSGSPAAGVVVVHVAGRVHRPGLVRLAPGSRVADALAAAGGPLPGVDLTTINLARVLVDGEQVLVAVAGAAAASGPGAGAAGSGATPGGTIDLNTATLDALETLPGVGPVLAQRIVDFRTAHGRFASVDELREVSGIGERKFADLSSRVRVG